MSGYEPLSEEERSALASLVDRAQRIDEAIGGFTDKSQIRKTGFSLHVKYERETDIQTSMDVAAMMSNPASLCALAVRLLAADQAVAS